MNTAEVQPLLICPLSNSELIDKIIVFAEELTGKPFYAYQALFVYRLVESVLDGDGSVLTALWARQCGKTESIANICCALAVLLPKLAFEFPDDQRFTPFKNGFLIGIYAPIDKQAMLPFGRIRKTLTSERGTAFLTDEELDIRITGNRSDAITLSNGSVIMCRTASPEAQIEGETHHLVITEESQKMSRSKVEKEIIPMLASTNGTLVKIGTAWHSKGGFHTSINYNEEVWRQGGKRNHFLITYEMVISDKRRMFKRDGNVFHLRYEKFINKEKRRLGGTDSDEFKMNFRCLFLESRVIAVKMSIFNEAAQKQLESGVSRWGYQVAGLDIGKTIDSTVLTIMNVDMEHPIYDKFLLPGADQNKSVYYRKTIVDWYELNGSFEGGDGQYNHLVQYLDETSVQILVVDASGSGNPVFERLCALLEGRIRVEPFVFGSSTKSNLYKYYLQELHARRVFYAAGEQTRERPEYMRFVQQHDDLEKTVSGNFILCQAPEGGHDDYPDSAALTCWAEKLAESTRMPVIDVSSGSLMGARSMSSPQAGRAGRYQRR